MDNYIKQVLGTERHYLGPNANVTKEELELYAIERERRLEWLESCKVVERVVAMREVRKPTGMEIQYFCKWQGNAQLVSTPLTLR